MLGFIGVLTDVTERREMEAEKLAIAEEVRAQQELAIGNLKRVVELTSRRHLS